MSRRRRDNSTFSRPSRSIPWFMLVIATMVLWCFGSLVFVSAKPPPPSQPNKRIISKKSTAGKIISKEHATTRQVIVHETEVWNGKAWKATKRWTTPEGKHSLAPPKLKPPKNYQWSDNWKIVTTNRDAMGWEYVWDQTQRPCKKRTWLRTAQLQEKPTKTKAVTTAATTKRKRRKLPLQEVWDTWNFKGFGWSFYKSLVYRDSFGVSFRTPISMNFDWCDRHPGFPSLTTSLSAYYPYMAVIFVNLSINLEWIKWQFAVWTARAQQAVILAIQITALILTLPLGLVNSKVTETSIRGIQYSLHNATIPEAPNYSLELQERLGMSFSWRLSQARGYETRTTYWFMCLPTLLYCGRLLSSPFVSVGNKLFPERTKKRIKTSLAIANWLRQHTGSFGIDTGGPVPSFPHFSFSLCLSLSGFFFRNMAATASSSKKSHVLSGVSSRDSQELLKSKTTTPPPIVSNRNNVTDTSPPPVILSPVETNKNNNTTSSAVRSSGGAMRVASS